MVLRLTVFSTVATSFSRKLPSPLSASSVRPDRAEEPLPPIEEPPIEEDMELPLSGVIFSSGSFS